MRVQITGTYWVPPVVGNYQIAAGSPGLNSFAILLAGPFM